MKRFLTALSFGAGVQSTALALLVSKEPDRVLEAMNGLPALAVFADTQREMKATYEHLAKMQSEVFSDSFPLKIVSHGDLGSMDITHGIQHLTFIPFYTKGVDGKVGMLRRKCTSEFKILPTQQAMRQAAGLKKGERGIRHQIKLWMGISIDEIHRTRTNHSPTFENIYPLIEMGLDRVDCWNICQKYGYSPPKSSCYFCPYRLDWAGMRQQFPDEWEKAVDFDRKIRYVSKGTKIEQPCYLHRSGKPLEDAVSAQLDLFSWDVDRWGFQQECEGMCGV